MTSLLPNRRKAVELADVLDRRRDSSDAEVRRLVGVAGAVRALPAVEPRVDFAVELRAQLVAAAERELIPAQRGADSRRPVAFPTASLRRRVGLVAAAGTFVAVGGGAGLASASAAAIPGELLYPVKRGVEQVELALATSDGDQGRAELDMGQTRLDEVNALLRSDDPAASQRIVDTLEDFTAAATDAGDHLVSSYEETDDPADLRVLHDYAQQYGDTLTDVGSMLPIEAAEAFADAAATVSTIDQQVFELCSPCAAGEPIVTVATDLVGSTGWQAIISPADGAGLMAGGGIPAAGGSDVAGLGVQLPSVDPSDLDGATGGGEDPGAGGNTNPATPATPGTPTTPGTPATPGSPGTPTTPGAPPTPGIPVVPDAPGDGPDVEIELDNPTDTLDDGDLNNAVDDLLGGSPGGGGGNDPGDGAVDDVGDVLDEVPVAPPTVELP